MTALLRRFPFLALTTLLLAVAVLIDPVQSLAAARQGVELWWTSVLPSLLLFFILNDLLQSLGVVKALGILLEPLMRPLFSLPGAAGFVVAVGFTSGFPAGARAAARLTAAGLCTAEEGSRLAAFANVAGPLFVSGVTAAAIFRTPAAAPLLALTHYGTALLVGLLLARLPSARAAGGRRGAPRRRNSLKEAWSALQTAGETAPPLGHLLGSVVREAGATVLMVGGFIVLFSVLIGLVEGSGAARAAARPLAWLLGRLGLTQGVSSAGVAGLFEVTSGLQRAAVASGPLAGRLAFASALLAWSGLSVHAQAAAVSADAGLSYRRFLEGRLVHTVLSPLVFAALWPLGPVLTPITPVVRSLNGFAGTPDSACRSLLGFAGILAALLLLSGCAVLVQHALGKVTVIWVSRPPRRS